MRSTCSRKCYNERKTEKTKGKVPETRGDGEGEQWVVRAVREVRWRWGSLTPTRRLKETTPCWRLRLRVKGRRRRAVVEDSGENRTAPQIFSIQLRNTLFFYSLLSLSLWYLFCEGGTHGHTLAGRRFAFWRLKLLLIFVLQNSIFFFNKKVPNY